LLEFNINLQITKLVGNSLCTEYRFIVSPHISSVDGLAVVVG
jgi:hypothetical protein